MSSITDWWMHHNDFLMYYHARSFVERINWLGGDGMISFPILVPMWYIRDLLVLVILAPLFFFLYKQRVIVRNIFIILITLIYITAIYPYIPGLSPGPVLFFSIGACLSLDGMSLTYSLYKRSMPALILFFILWIPLIPLAGYRTIKGNYLYPFFIISGVISIISLFSYICRNTKTNKVLSLLEFFRQREGDVFFIYAAHIIILPYVGNILIKAFTILLSINYSYTVSFVSQHPIMLIICYILKIAITICICILINQVLHRYFPKTCKLLLGR